MSDDGQVKSIIDRVQRLQEEKRTIEDDIKEVYAEARGNGYDVKVLRAVVKHLGKDQNEVAEFDAIFDLYLQSYLSADRPSRAHVARDAGARERGNETAGSAAQSPGNAAFGTPGLQPAEHDHVDSGASAQPHSAQGEPAIPSKAGDAGTGQASATDTGTTGQPSGAGTGSAVRAGAPVSEIATPEFQTAAQSEAAAGSIPEQGADERASGNGEVIAAQSAQFVTSSGEGEGAATPADPSPAADAPIKGLAAANAIAARAAQPSAPKVDRAEIDIEIPAFLRRTNGGNHPSFGEQA